MRSALNAQIPASLRDRRWWLLPMLVWALVILISLFQQLELLRLQSLNAASEGARNLFNMVVLTRAWNAGHGTVYAPVSEKSPPNPYLDHPRRDLLTQDGQRLTMINPAYMTRQISELARESGDAIFHITSLMPIRPLNAPDAWERAALTRFESGVKEVISLEPDSSGATRLRYMAPLQVKPPCMACHAKQGYKVGDIRGGISVSVPFDTLLHASQGARQQTWLKHGVIFLLISLLGWVTLELLRRRWHELATNLNKLESIRAEMLINNAKLAQARDAAESASRSKSAFMAAMSHELRTPLNGILGFAHLLQHGALPGKANEQARHIAEQGNNLHNLINEVLEFTRLESLQAPEHPGAIDFAALLAGMAEEFKRSAEANGLRVRLELAADLPARVVGERDWLFGCLRPLLNNAIKFTDQGEVALRAEVRASGAGETEAKPDAYLCRLRITISDTGIGIAEADRAKLFQPFRQIDDTTTRRHGGLGLGLAISARYAELLGASLTFESAPGQGSQFHLDWTTHTVAPLIDPVPHGEDATVSADPLALLDELEKLLSEDDLNSTAALAHALPVLAQMFDAEVLAQLKTAVEHYDFPAALISLRRLRADPATADTVLPTSLPESACTRDVATS